MGFPHGAFQKLRGVCRCLVGMCRRIAEEFKPQGKIVQFMSPLICMCSTMNRIDPQHLAWCLENLVEGKVVNEIRVDDHTRKWATVALERMLAIKGSGNPASKDQPTAHLVD